MRKSTFLFICLLSTIAFPSVALSGDRPQDDRVHTACEYLLKQQVGRAEELLRNPKTAQEKGLYAALISEDNVTRRFGFTTFDVDKADMLAKEALPDLQKDAEKNALSARILASLYYNGIGVGKDIAKAFHYCLQAAENGEAMAMNNVGFFYLNGIVVEEDKKRGVRWLRRAAAHGNTIAARTLGDSYINGTLAENDIAQAKLWYERAAKADNSCAMFRMWLLYAQRQILQNRRLQAKAQTRLERKGKAWLERAAKAGYVPAMGIIATVYEGGYYGYEQNEKEALRWYKKAANSGLADALVSLARCYEKGIGTSQDLQLAELYYGKAHEAAQQQGNEEVLKVTTAYKTARKIIEKILGESKTAVSQGTGFLVSQSGIIITNCHVAGDKSDITVLFPNNRATYEAEVLLKDTSNDLVILRLRDFTYKEISGEEIPYAFRRSSNVKLAEEVFTLGFPLGDTLGKNPKFSDGSVSALSGFAGNASLFQINNPVQPGNSGGPLFDEKGNVVGVVVSSLSPMFSGQGIIIPQNVNFAIKSDYLINLISMLPERDEILERISSLAGKELQEQVEALVPYIVTVYAK